MKSSKKSTFKLPQLPQPWVGEISKNGNVVVPNFRPDVLGLVRVYYTKNALETVNHCGFKPFPYSDGGFALDESNQCTASSYPIKITHEYLTEILDEKPVSNDRFSHNSDDPVISISSSIDSEDNDDDDSMYAIKSDHAEDEDSLYGEDNGSNEGSLHAPSPVPEIYLADVVALPLYDFDETSIDQLERFMVAGEHDDLSSGCYAWSTCPIGSKMSVVTDLEDICPMYPDVDDDLEKLRLWIRATCQQFTPKDPVPYEQAWHRACAERTRNILDHKRGYSKRLRTREMDQRDFPLRMVDSYGLTCEWGIRSSDGFFKTEHRDNLLHDVIPISSKSLTSRLNICQMVVIVKDPKTDHSHCLAPRLKPIDLPKFPHQNWDLPEASRMPVSDDAIRHKSFFFMRRNLRQRHRSRSEPPVSAYQLCRKCSYDNSCICRYPECPNGFLTKPLKGLESGQTTWVSNSIETFIESELRNDNYYMSISDWRQRQNQQFKYWKIGQFANTDKIRVSRKCLNEHFKIELRNCLSNDYNPVRSTPPYDMQELAKYERRDLRMSTMERQSTRRIKRRTSAPNNRPSSFFMSTEPRLSLGNRNGLPTLKFTLPNPDSMTAMLTAPNNESASSGDFNMDRFLDTMIDQMSTEDPMLQQLMEANPEIKEILSDKSFMKEQLQMLINPKMKDQMTRTTDRQLANLNGVPGAFNQLTKLHYDMKNSLAAEKVPVPGGPPKDLKEDPKIRRNAAINPFSNVKSSSGGLSMFGTNRSTSNRNLTEDNIIDRISDETSSIDDLTFDSEPEEGLEGQGPPAWLSETLDNDLY